MATTLAAVAVLMLALGAVTNVPPMQPTTLFAASVDSCGYTTTNTSTFVRGADAFNESGNIPTDGMKVDANGIIRVFASDETGLLLGANHAAANPDLDSDDPTVNASTPVSGHTSADVKSPTLSVGDRELVDLATGGGRPFHPSLYLTDLGTGPFVANVAKPGDWQALGGGGPLQTAPYSSTGQLNPGANTPNRATGEWAIAKVVTTTTTSDVESSSTSPTMTNPTTKNSWADIISIPGVGGTAPTSTTGENYKVQFQWDSTRTADPLQAWDPSANGGSGGLGPLQTGHTYKAQVILHDGDHGSDQSEACALLAIPVIPTTKLHGQVTDKVSCGGSCPNGDYVFYTMFTDSSCAGTGASLTPASNQIGTTVPDSQADSFFSSTGAGTTHYYVVSVSHTNDITAAYYTSPCTAERATLIGQ